MAIITTYKCTQCGTRVVVTENLESHLSPVYCCGVGVTKISSVGKKPSKTKKRAVKKKSTAQKKPRRK